MSIHNSSILLFNDCNNCYLKQFIRKNIHPFYNKIQHISYNHDNKLYKIPFIKKNNFIEYQCVNSIIDIIILYEEIIPFSKRTISFYTNMNKYIILHNINFLNIEDQISLIDTINSKIKNIKFIIKCSSYYNIHPNFFENSEIINPANFEKIIYDQSLLDDIIKENNIKNIFEEKISDILKKRDVIYIRQTISDFLVSNITPSEIFDIILSLCEKKYFNKLDQIISTICKYKFEMKSSCKYILHFESFFLVLFDII